MFAYVCVIKNVFLNDGPEQNRMKATALGYLLANTEDKTVIRLRISPVCTGLSSVHCAPMATRKKNVLPLILHFCSSS